MIGSLAADGSHRRVMGGFIALYEEDYLR